MPPIDPATQAAIEAALKASDFMAGKDAKWWFAFVLIIGGLAAMVIFKWLVASHQKYINSMEAQLTEQRTSNADLYKQLLGYIATDRAQTIDAINRMSDAMEKLATAINDRDRKA